MHENDDINEKQKRHGRFRNSCAVLEGGGRETCMNVSFYNSSMIQTLFSGMQGGSSKSSGSDLFGNLSSSLGDYASIRSGSYGKLLRAYYQTLDDDGKSSKTSTAKKSWDKKTLNTSTASDSTKTLAGIKSSAEDLKKSTDALKSSSLYEQKTVIAEDGTKTQEYDKEEIYKRLNAFVSDYNETITNAQKSGTRGIQIVSGSMITATNANRNMLKQIGITIGSDQKLKLEKDSFLKADMNTVKSLFQGSGSYGNSIASRASGIAGYAANEANKANTYKNTGGYANNFTTGELFQTML